MKKQSEKAIEAKLRKDVKKAGGIALKLLTLHFSGLPDRICLMPNAKVFFVETKSTGDKPSKIQKLVHGKLKKLGFPVYVIDNKNQIEEIINRYVTEDII